MGGGGGKKVIIPLDDESPRDLLSCGTVGMSQGIGDI
jgi:hypothetical protein